MVYISTHSRILLNFRLPTSVAGFRRRFEAETKEIDRTESRKRRVVLKVFRSWTLMAAKDRLGDVRFRQLLRELRISERSPKLAWHRLIAVNRDKLWRISEWAPVDDRRLAELARLNTDQIRRWVSEHGRESE